MNSNSSTILRAVRAAMMVGGCVFAMASHGAVAHAQDNESGGLSEIVVTAQKRAQSLQDVPIAISAMTENFLASRDIRSISQIENVAPNLRVLRSPGSGLTAQIAIRGSVTTNPALTNDPTVGMYLDGIYIGKAQGAIFDITDLERVEILRGPQGTLYGRNTLAGAISLVTRKPSGDFGGKVEARYGNYDYRRLRATLDLPAMGLFSAKLSGQIQKRDGFYDVVANPVAGVTKAGLTKSTQLDNVDNVGGMVQLRAVPTDTLTVDYSFDISRSDQSQTYAQPVQVDSAGIFSPTGFYGGLTDFPVHAYTSKRRPRRVSIDAPSQDFAKTWGHGLTVALDLGDAELKSITGLRKLQYIGVQDSDGTPLPIFAADRRSHYRSFSEELQLTGNTGALDYTLGVYYFHDKGRSSDLQTAFNGASKTQAHYDFVGESYAAFGQLEYKLSDSLSVIGGLRYTEETKQINRRAVNMLTDAVLIDTKINAVPDAKFKAVSPTAVVNYALNRSTNIYAKFAKGFKSGGFNGESNSLAELRSPYRPEKVDAFEIGLKGRYFGDLVQLNVAGFWNEVSDLQLAVLRVVDNVTVGEVRHAAKARIRGFEAEVTAQPVPSLLLQASFSHTSPVYKEFIDRGVDVSDNRSFNRVPKYTAFLSADWTAIDNGQAKLNVIADVNMVSNYHTAAFAMRAIKMPTIVRFRALPRSMRGWC